MSQFPQSSKKTRLLPSVLRLPSKTQNRLLPSTVVRAKPKKSRVASLGLETLSQKMANLFNSTHECLGQKKSLEGVLHKCQLGCRRQANPSSESKSFLVNQLLRGVGVILSRGWSAREKTGCRRRNALTEDL